VREVARPPVPVRHIARVVAVVVSWRQVDQLEACLVALDAQEDVDLDVVVVDNASGDGSIEVLHRAAAAARRHPLTVVANPTNRGFAGGVHDALAAAPRLADAVWLVNVDCVPEPDHLARLVAVLDAEPRCASVQGRLERSVRAADDGTIVDSTGVVATRARLFRDRDEGRRAGDVDRPAGEVFGVTGACALLRTAALEDVAWAGEGPWSRRVLTEDLFAYFDDVDLAWRLQRLGWRSRYEPAAVATHERGGAGPRRSAFVEELNAANRLLVVATHDTGRTIGRSWPVVTATTALKLAELGLTVPSAWRPALGRLRRGWSSARTRGRELDARARVPAATVVERWFEPFAWGPWIATWWRRVRGRAPGVAGGGRPPT
jgi:GT2 family glycosyltransferase